MSPSVPARVATLGPTDDQKEAGWMRIGWMGMVMVVLTALRTVPRAYASCAPPEPPRQNLQHSDAVFSGDVTNVPTVTVLHRMFNRGYPVTFRVLESWKGITTPTVTLQGQTHHSLAIRFEQGQQYLVYAYHGGDHSRGALTTNGCKGTKVLADAAADLDALGPGAMVVQPVAPARATAPVRLVLSVAALLVLCCAVVMVRRRRRR